MTEDFSTEEVVDDTDISHTPSVSERRRAGHYEILGETYAKFEFYENGWNPFSRFLDVDKVDLIIRQNTKGKIVYREVQVKYGKLYSVGQKWEQVLFDVTSWKFFKEGEFDAFAKRKDFFICLVLAADIGYRGDIFIFPVADFLRLLRESIPSGNGYKVMISRSKIDQNKWFLRRIGTKFSELTSENVVDVSVFRRNFSVLKP